MRDILPRCIHNAPLMDGAGELLEPPCGCRPKDEYLEGITAPVHEHTISPQRFRSTGTEYNHVAPTRISAPALLPCPHCGGEELEVPSTLARDAGWNDGVSCLECGATSYSREYWNSRYSPNPGAAPELKMRHRMKGSTVAFQIGYGNESNFTALAEIELRIAASVGGESVHLPAVVEEPPSDG